MGDEGMWGLISYSLLPTSFDTDSPKWPSAECVRFTGARPHIPSSPFLSPV
jgi:hypothetical protein